jgi:uncharacterized protein (DUF1684 family)
MTPAEHAARVIDWWATRDARLRDPDGWLTLIGLHWLSPGENRFGADLDNEVVLQGDDVPPVAGSLWVEDDAVRLVTDSPAVSAGGESVLEAASGVSLADDLSGKPTVLDLGSLRMYVIRRGDRLGLRVRDHASPELARFRGMDHFPIDPAWRLTGQLEPAAAGRTIEVVDVTGAVSHDLTPGQVAFERGGATWRVEALPGGDDGKLWLVFGDATNGRETYGGGRFLYTEPVADDGSVVLDFNLAYNPPCVFSPYATCPLPPPQNRLDLRIEAGERDYHLTSAAAD